MIDYDIRNVWRRHPRPTVRSLTSADTASVAALLDAAHDSFIDGDVSAFSTEYTGGRDRVDSIFETNHRVVGACLASVSSPAPTPAHPWSPVERANRADSPRNTLHIESLFWSAEVAPDPAFLLETAALLPAQIEGLAGVTAHVPFDAESRDPQSRLQQILARPDEHPTCGQLLETGFHLQGFLPGDQANPTAIFRWDNPAT